MNPRLLPLVLLTVFMATGCEDRQAPDASVGAPVAEAPALPETMRRESLASVAALQESRLVTVDAAELDSIEPPMHCSVDSINGAVPADASVMAGGEFQLSGWIEQGDTDANANAVIVVLRGDEGAYAFRARFESDRPDIASTVGVSKVSDVIGSATLEGVPAGEYAVYLVRTDAAQSKCVADSQVVIR